MTAERLSLRLHEPQQAHRALTRQAWPWIKAMLMAGNRMVLEARQETRSDAQNRLLHAWIGEIAKVCEWYGSKRSPEVWKRLLVAAWLRARGEFVEVLPALDGHGVDVVFRPTHTLTRSECAELSEFVMAWAAQHGIEWRDPSARAATVDADTGEILEAA